MQKRGMRLVSRSGSVFLNRTDKTCKSWFIKLDTWSCSVWWFFSNCRRHQLLKPFETLNSELWTIADIAKNVHLTPGDRVGKSWCHFYDHSSCCRMSRKILKPASSQIQIRIDRKYSWKGVLRCIFKVLGASEENLFTLEAPLLHLTFKSLAESDYLWF